MREGGREEERSERGLGEMRKGGIDGWMEEGGKSERHVVDPGTI